MTPQERKEELVKILIQIPPGRVTSYGCVGKQLSQRLSGLLVGRMLADLPSGTSAPWWRVVRSDGYLVTFRRDVSIGTEQCERLQSEGVPVDDQNCVDMQSYGFWFE